MGTEEGLIYELFRQFPPERQARIVQRLQGRSLAGVKPADASTVDAVPRDEHERIVARLNEKVAALNARLERRKAG